MSSAVALQVGRTLEGHATNGTDKLVGFLLALLLVHDTHNRTVKGLWTSRRATRERSQAIVPIKVHLKFPVIPQDSWTKMAIWSFLGR